MTSAWRHPQFSAYALRPRGRRRRSNNSCDATSQSAPDTRDRPARHTHVSSPRRATRAAAGSTAVRRCSAGGQERSGKKVSSLTSLPRPKPTRSSTEAAKSRTATATYRRRRRTYTHRARERRVAPPLAAWYPTVSTGSQSECSPHLIPTSGTARSSRCQGSERGSGCVSSLKRSRDAVRDDDDQIAFATRLLACWF